MRFHSCAWKKSRACLNSSHGHPPDTWRFVDKAVPASDSHRNPPVTHRPIGLVRVADQSPSPGLTVTRLRRMARAHAHDREILRLAVPAFLALVAEPLFLLTDAAIVGHLGTAELAGLGHRRGGAADRRSGCASSWPTAPPPSVARHLGAGDLRGALAQGIDGVWLAVGIGVVATVLGVAAHRARWSPRSAPGTRCGAGRDVPADRLPRHHAAAGHARRHRRAARPPGHPHAARRSRSAATRSTSSLNLLLVYGPARPGLGIAGSALGSVLAQVASAGGAARRRRPRRPPGGRPAAPRPARHPGRRPRRACRW